jgi:hypothetical protein
MRRDRGLSLLQVFIAITVLSAVATTWASAYHAATAHAERGVDRARARALADAAWTRARLALERGEDPASDGPFLDGSARVVSTKRANGWRVVVVARVVHRPGRDSVACELILDVALYAGEVRVLSRREVSS